MKQNTLGLAIENKLYNYVATIIVFLKLIAHQNKEVAACHMHALCMTANDLKFDIVYGRRLHLQAS